MYDCAVIRLEGNDNPGKPIIAVVVAWLQTPSNLHKVHATTNCFWKKKVEKKEEKERRQEKERAQNVYGLLSAIYYNNNNDHVYYFLSTTSNQSRKNKNWGS